MEVQYLALLRGINVGGNNLIKMTDLKVCFESMGFVEVATYIQSGNVLFQSEEQNPVVLVAKIEKELSHRFDYQSKIVLINHNQLEVIVNTAPADFGHNSDEYRYDVLFLKEPLTSSEVLEVVKVKEGVDKAYSGQGVVYFSRLIVRASQSYLSRIISHPVYKNISIRNWNTTTKLLGLMNNNELR